MTSKLRWLAYVATTCFETAERWRRVPTWAWACWSSFSTWRRLRLTRSGGGEDLRVLRCSLETPQATEPSLSRR